MRHINELMIGQIPDMWYHTAACDLRAANDVRDDLSGTDLYTQVNFTNGIYAFESTTHWLTIAPSRSKKSDRVRIMSYTWVILPYPMDATNEAKIDAKISYLARGASHCKHHNHSC